VFTALALAMLVAGAVVGTFRWLESPQGGEYLRRKVLQSTDGVVAGKIELDTVRLSGLLGLDISGARLLAPGEKHPVISVGHLRLRFQALALALHQLEVAELSVDRPHVHILQRGATTNLALALANPPAAGGATPPPPPASAPQPLPQLHLSIEEVHLRDGELDMDGSQPVALEALRLDGSVTGSLQRLALIATLQTRLHAPIERSVALELRGTYDLDANSARVDRLALQTGTSRVALSGSVAFDLSALHLDVEQLAIAAEDVNAFVPDARVLGGLQLTGTATLANHAAQMNLAVELPAGHVLLDTSAGLGASGALTDLVHYSGRLVLNGVEPQRLRSDLPRAGVDLELSVQGDGMPGVGKATLELQASGSRYEDLFIDQLRLAGAVEGQTLHVKRLALSAAGADLKAHGTAAQSSGDLELTLSLASLEKTRALLTSGLHLDIPPVTGSIDAAVHVAGDWTAPRLDVALAAPTFAMQGTDVAGLHAHVDLKQLLPTPLGTVDVRIDQVHAAHREGHDIVLTGHNDGRTAVADAQGTYGEQPLSLTIRAGHLAHRAGTDEWNVEVFQAGALGLSVATKHAAQIGWGSGRVRVAGLDLHGALGHITLDTDAGMTGPLRGRLHISGLDLTRLPSWILPPELNLGGILQLDADVRGTAAKPDATVDLQLAGAQFRQLSGASVDAELRVADERLGGNLHVGFPEGDFSLSFHAPWGTSPGDYLGRLADEPLDLEVAGDHLALELMHRIEPSIPALGGVGKGTAELHGTLRHPVLQMQSRIDGASYARLDGLGLDIGAALEGGRWTITGAAQDTHGLALATTSHLDLPILEVLKDDIRLMERAFDVDVVLRDLDLAWLPLLGAGPKDLVGHATGHIMFSGKVGVPVTDTILQVAGAGGAGYQGLDGRLEIKTSEQIAVTMNTLLGGHPLLDLSAMADVAPWPLSAMTTLERKRIPLQVSAELSPTLVSTLLPAAAPQPGDEEPPFRGKVGATLFVGGTANVPQAHLRISLSEAQLNGHVVGVCTTDADYRSGTAALSTVFESKTAGRLRADAVLHANLGLASILDEGAVELRQYVGPPRTRPSAWEAGLAETVSSRFQLSVDADQLDLGLLNGFTGMARSLGGKLDLHLHKDGPLAPLAADGSLQPTSVLTGLSGSLAIADAHSNLIGMGSYANVSLKADGAWPAIEVSELRGKAGEGTFAGHLKLLRTGPGQFTTALALTLQSFPLVEDFQTKGVVSFQLDGEAHGNGNHVDIPELVISKGHIIIPTQLSKRVQLLSPNPDFELSEEPKVRAARRRKRTNDGQGWLVTVDRITIPDDLVVDAPLGTRLTLGAALKLVEDPRLPPGEQLALTGNITIAHGILSLLQPFDVDKGVITFYPGQLDEPSVDVKAHYNGPDVQVRVAITGTMADLRKEFTSTPAMTENEILYYLTTGNRQTQAQQADPVSLQTQMTDAALNALGAAAIGAVKGMVQDVLPAALNPDILTVETDAANKTVGRVRAGKYYLNGRLYIGGQYNPGANPALNQNTYEGEVQYRINTQNFVRLLVGNEGHDQLDYLFELNLPTKEQRDHGMGQ
jgi:autotransporter translocation and assembly factor TamB